MKTWLHTLIITVLLLGGGTLLQAEPPSDIPSKIVTSADFRELLLHTKWTWKNVTAGVPDRECVFMPEGTFRHPHFVAKFTIKDLHTVELAAKGKHATMNFDAAYASFDAIDFGKLRVTGKRMK